MNSPTSAPTFGLIHTCYCARLLLIHQQTSHLIGSCPSFTWYFHTTLNMETLDSCSCSTFLLSLSACSNDLSLRAGFTCSRMNIALIYSLTFSLMQLYLKVHFQQWCLMRSEVKQSWISHPESVVKHSQLSLTAVGVPVDIFWLRFVHFLVCCCLLRLTIRTWNVLNL